MIFCVFPANFIWIIFFYDVWMGIPNQFGTLSQSFFKRSFLNCLSHNSASEENHTHSDHAEKLGLPYWTMIQVICVVVDEPKCLDTPIWEFSTIREKLPFLPVGWADTTSLACLSQTGTLEMMFGSLVSVICDTDWSLFSSYCLKLSCLPAHHLGIQLNFCIFGALPPIQHLSNDTF